MTRVVLAVAFAVYVASLVGYADMATAEQRPVRPPLPTNIAQIRLGVTCPGLPGYNCWDYATRTVYIDPESTDDEATKQHEYGHAFDDESMDSGERHDFARIYGQPARAWTGTCLTFTPGNCLTSTVGLSEVFADAYATCRMRWLPHAFTSRSGYFDSTDWYDSEYHYRPRTNAHQRTICRAVARYGRDLSPTRDRASDTPRAY